MEQPKVSNEKRASWTVALLPSELRKIKRLAKRRGLPPALLFRISAMQVIEQELKAKDDEPTQ